MMKESKKIFNMNTGNLKNKILEKVFEEDKEIWLKNDEKAIKKEEEWFRKFRKRTIKTVPKDKF